MSCDGAHREVSSGSLPRSTPPTKLCISTRTRLWVHSAALNNAARQIDGELIDAAPSPGCMGATQQWSRTHGPALDRMPRGRDGFCPYLVLDAGRTEPPNGLGIRFNSRRARSLDLRSRSCIVTDCSKHYLCDNRQKKTTMLLTEAKRLTLPNLRIIHRVV